MNHIKLFNFIEKYKTQISAVHFNHGVHFVVPPPMLLIRYRFFWQLESECESVLVDSVSANIKGIPRRQWVWQEWKMWK